MKSKHLISLLQIGYTTIEVVFQNDSNRQVPSTGRHYTYKTKHLDLAVGQTVVVRVSGRYALAEVVKIHDIPQIDVDAEFEYKWIVQLVDPTEYNEIMDAERAFKETLQEVEKIKQREVMIEDFNKHLPIGSNARLLFDEAIKNFAPSLSNETKTS